MREQLERIGKCGAWITASPDKLRGTLLSRDKWLDSTGVRYGMCSLDLQDCCDACGQGFSIVHGISCKTVCFVGLSRNDARDKAGGLSEAALGKTYVLYEPMFFFLYGCVGFPARDALGSSQQARHRRHQRYM